MKAYLLIEHIKIHNANALSTPYIVGFPAMTAWLGCVEGLNLRLKKKDFSVRLKKTAVSCHQCNLQAYRENGYRKVLCNYRKQIDEIKKNVCQPPSIIEEGRCHLDVSLLVEIEGVNGQNKEEFCVAVEANLMQMKMAGGDIQSIKKIQCVFISGKEDEEKEEKALIRKLMPGYIITERRDLLQNSKEADALDRLLNPLSLLYEPDEGKNSEENSITWKSRKEQPGWIIPIGVGFKAISALGTVKNQRDVTKPHRFVENVVTLAEFSLAYRFTEIESIMWEYKTIPEDGLYVCVNQE